MSNIKFPDEFRALKKYSGYFWHSEEKQLYSIKVAGVLKPLTLQNSSFLRRKYGFGAHYQISVNGKTKYIVVSDIDRYLDKSDIHIIPKKGVFNVIDI